MCASLHVNIGPPKNGWMRLRAQTKGGGFDLTASYTPYDTLTELVEAISNIHESHRPQEVRVNEEPEESVLRLRKDVDHLVMEHLRLQQNEARLCATLRTGFQSGCREFARQLKFLLDHNGYEGIVEEWRRKPPRAEILRLWKRFV